MTVQIGIQKTGALKEALSVPHRGSAEQVAEYIFPGAVLNGFPFEIPPLKREDYDAYLACADKVDKVVYWPEWRQEFQTEMRRYLRGEVSYEEAAASARYKLVFYLSE